MTKVNVSSNDRLYMLSQTYGLPTVPLRGLRLHKETLFVFPCQIRGAEASRLAELCAVCVSGSR